MPGTGTRPGLESTRGTETGHAGRGIHTFGPGGAWRDGIGVLGQKKLAWENWWREFGVFGPWSRRGKDWRGCGSAVAGVPANGCHLGPCHHASVQGSPKLGLLHLLRSTEGAGSPARPGAGAALGSQQPRSGRRPFFSTRRITNSVPNQASEGLLSRRQFIQARQQPKQRGRPLWRLHIL